MSGGENAYPGGVPEFGVFYTPCCSASKTLLLLLLLLLLPNVLLLLLHALLLLLTFLVPSSYTPRSS